MKIDSLKLQNFRNYEELSLEFSPGTNLFYGENAQGKTNILEAVYVCGTTKSHRTSKDREMIRFGENESHLQMIMRKGDVSWRIDLLLRAGRAKGIAVNMVPVRRAVFWIWSSASLTRYMSLPSRPTTRYWNSAESF